MIYSFDQMRACIADYLAAHKNDLHALDKAIMAACTEAFNAGLTLGREEAKQEPE